MSVWTMASIDPTIRVTAARTQMTGRQSTLAVGKAPRRMRMRAAKPPALATAAMNPVAGVGAPWYTSGVQVWNGTAATLKPSPTMTSTMPASRMLLGTWVWARNTAISDSRVDPVAPYTRATPYRKMADEKAPRMKYFID